MQVRNEKKPRFSTHFRLSGVVHLATTHCLLSHYICLGCSPGYLPPQQFFRKISKLALLLLYTCSVRSNNYQSFIAYL